MGSLGKLRKSDVKKRISVDETTDMALFVRTSDEDMAVWNRRRIVDALVREAYVDPATAEEISKEVQEQIVASGTTVITAPLIREVMQLAGETKTILTVDPKFNNFFEYTSATVFKPNRKETEEALGIRMTSDTDIEQAGKELLQKLKADNVLLTLGEKGMALFESSGEVSRVSTKARHVADVSGAGDMVIATLTMALAAGADIRQAAMLANFADGIVCGEVGIVPIERDVLFEEVSGSEHMEGGH